MTDGTVQVAVAEARVRARGYLIARGAPAETADIQVAHLVEAELRGHPSHGLRRLEVLGARIDNGLLDPAALPAFTWCGEAAVRVDGRRGFGPVTVASTIETLMARRETTGVAVAAMHNTHHLGMLAPYVERIAEAGAVGVVLSSTEGLVHAWGGAGALLGTNPIGVGVPASGGDLILDMSSGSVSAGKILDHRAKGLPLPAGWAVDSDGVPTTDAAAAAEGAISPFGGPKGYALGLAFGAIVGALTGTAFGPDVHGTLDTDLPTSKGDVIVVFDPVLLAGSDTSSTLGAYLDDVRASGVRGPALVPGDRARAMRDQRVASGLRIAVDVWRMIEPFDSAHAAPQPSEEDPS